MRLQKHQSVRIMQLILLLFSTVVAHLNTFCWVNDTIQEPTVGFDIGLTHGFVSQKLSILFDSNVVRQDRYYSFP